MKRIALIAAALGTLVAASAAVAHLRAADVTAAAATLTATAPTNVETRTFTCDGQTFEVTTGKWTGTATSTTADLNGAAALYLKSVYNTTKKLGWVEGRLKIAASDDRTHLHVSGVNTDGTIDGWVRGHAGRGDGSVFGSLAGTFSKTGGLTAGAIGSGSATNAAVIAKHIRCSEQKTTRPSVHLFVRGQIETVSATSITVKPKDGSASQTCAVKDDDDVDNVKSGDQVEMACSQVAGAWVLVKVRKR
jgi:hypothetical protein